MQLVVQNGPDAGKTFELVSPLQIVGRQVGSDITLNDGQVSRRHAQVENRNGTIIVTDLGSANGSYLNSQRLTPSTPMTVKAGDNLRFGDTSLLVRENPVTGVSSSQPTQYVRPEPSAFNQAQPGYPSQPVPPSQPNYQQPPAYQQPSYQQPAQQPPSYQQPSYQQPAQQPQGYQPQSYQQPQPYYNAQVQPGYPPAGAPPKKGKGGLIAILIGLVVVIAAAVGAFFVLNKDSNPTSTVTPAVFTTQATTSGPVATTTAPPQGSSGTNAPPPAPGQLSSSNTVSSLGVKVTFPSGWQSRTVDQGDTGQIQAAGPDGGFVIIYRLVGLPGDLTSKTNSLIVTLKNNYSDLAVTQGPTSSPGATQEVIVFEAEYTETRTNTAVRSHFYTTENTAKEFYIIQFGADKAKFNAQLPTFNTIRDSIKFS